MNKLIKILSVIVVCLTAQVGMASAPAARAADRKIVSADALMRGLKYGFEGYYNTYSHSLEIVKSKIASNDKEYNEFIDSFMAAVEDLCARELINRITDEESNTPLILAAKYNCPIMVEYLIEKCGFTNFDAKNVYGRTAFDYMRTPSDRIGSSELDDENSVKVQDDQIVSLKHKPVIHGNKKVAEYLKSKRLKYKFEQAAARNSRLTKPKAQDAKKADQRTNRNADKKQNSDTTLEKIREKTRADVAARIEKERIQAIQLAKETAQQVEEEKRAQEHRIALQRQKACFRSKIMRKMIQMWKSIALESRKKKEVERNGVVHAFNMRAVHEDPYWHTRYQGDAQASVVRNELVLKEDLNAKDAVQWWHDHKQENCAVCEKYKQAQLAAAAQPKKLERRKSF